MGKLNNKFKNLVLKAKIYIPPKTHYQYAQV